LGSSASVTNMLASTCERDTHPKPHPPAPASHRAGMRYVRAPHDEGRVSLDTDGYKRFVLTITDKVANAHREHGKGSQRRRISRRLWDGGFVQWRCARGGRVADQARTSRCGRAAS